MVRIYLERATPYRALDGNKYYETAKITRETERAFLLEISRGPTIHKYWIPKSISLRLKSFVEVPDWFWEDAKENATRMAAESRRGRR
jgi:hypothetical protein